jgi:vancomycin resistance protein YoaR
MQSTPLPQRPAVAIHRSRWSPWWIRLPILTISGSVLLVLVLIFFFMAFQIRHGERIFPGVKVEGVDVGSMTRSEAQIALAGRLTYPRDAIFTFRDGGQVWQMSAADLGVSYDVEQTVNAAFAVGHEGNLALDLLAQTGAWFNGASIAPMLRYDETLAQAQLMAMALKIDRPAQNATLMLNGATVNTTPGQTGRTLDTTATLARLREAILRLDRGLEIALVVNETPPLIWNVDTPAAQIQAAFSGPLTLTAADANNQPLGPWTVTPEQIASLLRVEQIANGDGTLSYSVSIDMEPFRASVAALAPGLIVPTRDGRFIMNDATGQLEVLQPSVSGRTLDVDATLKAMSDAVFTDQRTVPLAFNTTLPTLNNQVTAQELGIKEIVAESKTYFKGSGPNRRANIALAASKFNGVIIAPGQEFSFNTLLGEIGPETGFLEDKVIFGGRTTLDYGGGACQVSTTVFRAAFAGGFPITERNSHGYRVGYYEQGGYPPGMDASIWQPERDFKFQNNTPYYILIETDVFPADDALQFRFYSTKYWNATIDQAIIRDVTPAEPTRYEMNKDLRIGDILQVDYAAEGADVYVARKVYDLQGQLYKEETLYTHYLPWAAVYQVAPGDSRLSG